MQTEKQLPQGTRVKFNIPTILQGTGTIVGQSNAGLPLLGRGFIVQTDEDISNETYPYKNHLIVWESQFEVITPDYKVGDVVDFVNLNLDIDGGVSDTAIILKIDTNIYTVSGISCKQKSIDISYIIKRHEFNWQDIKAAKHDFVKTSDQYDSYLNKNDGFYEMCCHWYYKKLIP